MDFVLKTRKWYDFKDETVRYANNSCEAWGKGPPAQVSACESKNQEPEINREKEEREKNKNNT